MYKKNKYGNQPVVGFGKRFDSRREFNYYCELRLLEKSGAIRNLHTKDPENVHLLFEKKRKPEWVLEKEKGRRKPKFVPSFKYVSDFEYDDLRDQRHHTVDVKGFRTPVFILKKALLYWLTDIWVEEVKV